MVTPWPINETVTEVAVNTAISKEIPVGDKGAKSVQLRRAELDVGIPGYVANTLTMSQVALYAGKQGLLCTPDLGTSGCLSTKRIFAAGGAAAIDSMSVAGPHVYEGPLDLPLNEDGYHYVTLAVKGTLNPAAHLLKATVRIDAYIEN